MLGVSIESIVPAKMMLLKDLGSSFLLVEPLLAHEIQTVNPGLVLTRSKFWGEYISLRIQKKKHTHTQKKNSGTQFHPSPFQKNKKQQILTCLRPSGALCATWENQQPASHGIAIENVGSLQTLLELNGLPRKMGLIQSHIPVIDLSTKCT